MNRSLLSQGINGPKRGLRHDLSSKRQSVTRCTPVRSLGDGYQLPHGQYPEHATLWRTLLIDLQLDLAVAPLLAA